MAVHRGLKGVLLTALALPCLLVLALVLRGLTAETADLRSYDPARDAGRYLSLPFSGANFRAYSRLGHGAGRCYLRGSAAAAVLAAYASLERRSPEYRYLYGETGRKGGGEFWPHRTHRRGLSADFLTPVRRTGAGSGGPERLPVSLFNLWGYNIRLDAHGTYRAYRLDAPAMIAHLAALRAAAADHGLRIERVIFDPPLLKLLRADPGFAALRGLNFMENRAWFPHDGHYHVDFAE